MIIYVDFDGTLAHLDGWEGQEHTCNPIPLMVKKVESYLKKGDKVVIYTARLVASSEWGEVNPKRVREVIENWCVKHLGIKLPITNIKGPADVFLDDRAVRIVKNTGLTTGEFLSNIIEQELTRETTKEETLKLLLNVIKQIEQENT